jgi:hypothetical protein
MENNSPPGYVDSQSTTQTTPQASSLGPIGLFYASVVGGIIMLILFVIIGIITLGFGLIFIWIESIIWAVIAASSTSAVSRNTFQYLNSPPINPILHHPTNRTNRCTRC